MIQQFVRGPPRRTHMMKTPRTREKLRRNFYTQGTVGVPEVVDTPVAAARLDRPYLYVQREVMTEANPIGIAHVPRHSRALGGRSYGGRHGQRPNQYASIGRETAAAAVGDDEARRETMNRSSSRRGLAAIAVCVGFVAAVTLFSRVDPQQSTGSSYRGVLKVGWKDAIYMVD